MAPMDSNHHYRIQRPASCHWTRGQCALRGRSGSRMLTGEGIDGEGRQSIGPSQPIESRSTCSIACCSSVGFTGFAMDLRAP